MDKKFCDRCNKEIKKDKDKNYRLTELYSGNGETTPDTYYDLCNNCHVYQKMFLKGQFIPPFE